MLDGEIPGIGYGATPVPLSSVEPFTLPVTLSVAVTSPNADGANTSEIRHETPEARDAGQLLVWENAELPLIVIALITRGPYPELVSPRLPCALSLVGTGFGKLLVAGGKFMAGAVGTGATPVATIAVGIPASV